MLGNRVLRSFALNAVFFLSIALAHHLGGGDLAPSPLLAPLFFLSTFLFAIRPPRELDGPFLAFILLLFQVLGHLAFHLPPAQSFVRMSTAHIVAVVISFVATRKFEECFLNLLAFVHWAFIPSTFKRFTFSYQEIFGGFRFICGFRNELFRSINHTRAPPILLAD